VDMDGTTYTEKRPLSDLTVEEVERVYSGKPGCGCGCRGRYYESGPMVAKVLKLVQAAVAAGQDRNGVEGSMAYWESETRYYWVYAKVELSTRPARPVHTVGGKPIGPEGVPYGTTHDWDCPGCKDIPYLSSPRSETYWAS